MFDWLRVGEDIIAVNVVFLLPMSSFVGYCGWRRQKVIIIELMWRSFFIIIKLDLAVKGCFVWILQLLIRTLRVLGIRYIVRSLIYLELCLHTHAFPAPLVVVLMYAHAHVEHTIKYGCSLKWIFHR